MPRKRVLSAYHAILLILFVVLIGTWLKLGSTKRKGTGEESTLPQRPEFPADSVSEIEIERGGTTFRLVREGEEFWLVEPYRDRANVELVAQSIHVAATLRPLRVLPDTVSAPFGVDRPVSIWRCRWPHGIYAIAIGDSLPGGGGRYARRTGSAKILVIDDFLARRYIAPPIRSLHDPVAAPLEVGPVDTVRVTTREEQIVIVRRRNNLWEILSPIRGEASATEMVRGVQALRTAELTDVLGPSGNFDLRRFGLAPPRAVWSLIQGNRRVTVQIGSPTPDQRSVRIIPADRDVVCLTASEAFRTWVDGLKRLREARIFRSAADSLVRITIRGAREGRTFLRSPGRGWVEITGKDTLDVGQDAIERAAVNLCAIQAVRFGTAWPVSGTRTIHIGLAFRDGGRDSMDVAPAEAGMAVVRAARLPSPCAVPGVLYETWLRWLEQPIRN